MPGETVLEAGGLPHGLAGPQGWRRWALRLDAAYRLGFRPVGLMLWHRYRLRAGLAHRALPDLAPPIGPFLPGSPPVAPRVTTGLGMYDWHGPYGAAVHALDISAHAGGDLRLLWEAHRLSALLALAIAARRDPKGGALARVEALLADWSAANPPFRGPGWACAQEAALRAMNFALALALLGADQALTPAARQFLEQHARRIRATPAYGAAQDNNHPISEAAGLFVCGLLLRDQRDQRQGARALLRAITRLVSPCGAFAQASPTYHRLMLDTIAVAEWFRQRHQAPGFGAEFAARAAAATLWLERVMAPDGALPRIGPCDDSCFADLSQAGPHDARGSLERAARLFLGRSAGFPADAGCAVLGLQPLAGARVAAPNRWRSAGWLGLRGAGGAQGLLRTGVPLRFRPGQADLLHFDLWDGAENLLRDGGSGAYFPPLGLGWWQAALADGAGHNLIIFDGAEPMPRLGPFLLARWPRCRAIPDGAKSRDWRGNRHARRIEQRGRVWRVEDRLRGPFRHLRLRWRIAPGDWEARGNGFASGKGVISLSADAPFTLALVQGHESPVYGRVVPAPVIELNAAAPISRIFTEITLPPLPRCGAA